MVMIVDTIAGTTFNPWLKRHPNVLWAYVAVQSAAALAVLIYLL